MKNKNPRQQVVRLLSLLLFIATVVFFHRCRQPSAAQAFIPENIRERTQQPYLSGVFKEADSLKYELDYFNAANRYHSQLASARLHFHEKIYAFNQLAYLYLSVHQVDRAAAFIDSVAVHRAYLEKQAAWLIADLDMNLGVFFFQKQQPEPALLKLQAAFDNYNRFLGATHYKTAEALNYVGLLYFEFLASPDSAISYIERAHRIFTALPAKYRAQNELAMALQMRIRWGYAASIAHAETAIEYLRAAPWTDTVAWACALSNQARIFKARKDYSQSALLFEQAISLAKQVSTPRLQEFYREYAIMKIINSDTSGFLAVMDALQKHLQSQPDLYAKADYLWAYYYFMQKNARKTIDAGQQFLKRNPVNDFFERDRVNLWLAKCYLKVLEFDSSFIYCREGLLSGSNLSGKAIGYKKLLSPDVYSKLTNPFVYYGLMGEVFLERYRNLHQLTDLKKSTEVFDLTDQLLFMGNITSNSEDALLSMEAETAEQIYSNAVQAVHAAYTKAGLREKKKWLNQAFKYCERQKSYTLFRSIKTDTTGENMPPASMIEEIRRLNSIINNNAASESSKAVSSAQLELLHKQISQQYPDFLTSKINQPIATIDEVRSSLEQNQCVLQFFIAPQNWYLLYVDKFESRFVEFENTAALRNSVQEFRSQLETPPNHQTTGQYVGLLNTSYSLYKILFSRLEPLINKQQYMVIISDGFLNGIPFEALISQPVSKEEALPYDKADFLVKRFLFCYAPSWKVHQHNRQKIGRFYWNDIMIGVFTYGESSAPDALLYASDELEAIKLNKRYNKVLVFQGDTCNRTNFELQSPKFDLLHLCLHAASNSLNRNDQKIFFSIRKSGGKFDTVYANHIAQLDLKAKLVVLSACQTASGTTLGEGVFSLARAFMLAGTPAVLASLWKIDDNANAALIATFYEKLAAGAPPEIAIRNAKLDFLATPKPGKRHHPYYWAGMTMWR